MPNGRKNEMGVCPKCGVDGQLEYQAAEFDESIMYYPYECSACHFKGREYYYLHFDTHTDEDGREPNQEGFNS